MPFELVNAPATFQAMINHGFRDMLDQGALAFMDEGSWPTHIENLRPPMTKAPQVYGAVASEAAARGGCAMVWDRNGKFTGWIYEIQHESNPK